MKRKLLPLLLISTLPFSFAVGGTYTADWLGGTAWEQDGAWSTTAYPNNGHFVVLNGNPVPDGSPLYNVSIANAAPCILSIGVTVQATAVAQGATLTVANGGAVVSNGTFGANGLVTLNSTGSGARLTQGNGSGIGSTGQIVMSDSGTNNISANNHGDTFTIAAGGVIRGAGQLNYGYFGDSAHLLNYVNHGLIESTQPNNALQIGLGGQTGVNANLTNDGTLRASGNSILRIHAFNTSGTVFNAGGTIRAIDNAQVRIAPTATITGGTVTTSGSGSIRGDGVGGGGGVLKDLTNTGAVVIANGEELSLAGTFTNNGSVTVSSTGSGAILRLTNGGTLAGNGAVTLSNNGSNYIMAVGQGDAYTIAPGATIQGAGQISPGFSGGSNMLKLTNRGLINANVSGGGLNIRVEKSNDTNLTNTRTLRASNGGTLTFYGGGTVFNAGGTIEAQDGSAVRIAPSTTVSGGTLATTGTGAIRGNTPGNGGGVLADVTNNGLVAIANGEELTLGGTFTNNGNLTMDSTGGGAVLRVANGTTLAGSGAIVLSNNGTNYLMGVNGGETFTIAPGATLRGAGNLSPGFSGGGNMVKITNQGLLDANISGAGLVIRAESSNNTDFTNTGTFRASNGGTLHFTGGGSVTNNGGTVVVQGGSTISSAGGNPFSQSAGTINLDGTMTFPQGLDLNGGQLVGTGTFTGPVRNNGGIVAPGHSPGKLTIDGNYTQAGAGTLNIEIGGSTAGTDYDQLRVNGAATLGGTLNITFVNGYRPVVGDVFNFLAPNAVSGAFSSVTVNGVAGKVDYSSGAVTLTVTQVPDILLNISTRLAVLTDDKALIGGFIVTGTEPKKVIIRGLGPSLPVAGALVDPTLDLYDGSNKLLFSNDNWKDTQQAEIEATTIPPSKDAEAAMVQTLAPGAYTAVLRGKGNITGVGLLELYDLGQSAKSKAANISTRGFCDAGDNVLIGGFIVGGGGGGGDTAKVIVRAIGPSLTKAGLSGVLQDPTLELKDANGSSLATNDNWKDTQQAEIQATGIPPTDDLESAIVRSLPPGAYTAIVRGKNNGTGISLVEVYNLQ